MRALKINLVGLFLLYFVCEGDNMNLYFGPLGPHSLTVQQEIIPNRLWTLFEGKTHGKSSKRSVHMKKLTYFRDNVPLENQSDELSDKIKYAIKLNRTVLTPKGLSPGYLAYIREQKNKMKKLIPRRHHEELKPNRGLFRKRSKLKIPVLTLPSWMERLGFGKGYTDEDLPFLMDFEQDSSWEMNKKKSDDNVEIIQGNLMFI